MLEIQRGNTETLKKLAKGKLFHSCLKSVLCVDCLTCWVCRADTVVELLSLSLECFVWWWWLFDLLCGQLSSFKSCLKSFLCAGDLTSWMCCVDSWALLGLFLFKSSVFCVIWWNVLCGCLFKSWVFRVMMVIVWLDNWFVSSVHQGQCTQLKRWLRDMRYSREGITWERGRKKGCHLFGDRKRLNSYK